MLGDVRLNEEKEGVAGDVYILDASVATPTHFAKFTPTLVKKFLVCVQVRRNMRYLNPSQGTGGNATGISSIQYSFINPLPILIY